MYYKHVTIGAFKMLRLYHASRYYHRLNLLVATSFINQTDNLILFSIYERLGRIQTKHRLRIRDIFVKMSFFAGDLVGLI